MADKEEQAETLRVAVVTTDVLIRATTAALPDPGSLQAVSDSVQPVSRKPR